MTLIRKPGAAAGVLVLAAVVAVALASLAAQTPADGPFDVVIRNGKVIDGMGNPWRWADVGVRGGRIVQVGRVEGAPRRSWTRPGSSAPASSMCIHMPRRASPRSSTTRAAPGTRHHDGRAEPRRWGPTDIAAQRALYEKAGIAVNAALFVRTAACGRSSSAWTTARRRPRNSPACRTSCARA